MRIEEGKFYRTRDGRKVGPAKLYSTKFGFWSLGENFAACHEADGTYIPGKVLPDDLVAEWTDAGPVRTVTRQEIVDGEYGGVTVGYTRGSEWVYVGLKPERYDADQLERAAAVLTALAGALRDGE